MSATDARRVARIYQDTRERITSLLSDLDDAALNTAITACPGWSVRDVVAHLAAVADDFGHGRLQDTEYRSGPENGAEIHLRTTRFEALRWRTGRRSRAQLAAMDWSNDPTPVLDHLCMFGPAKTDIVE